MVRRLLNVIVIKILTCAVGGASVSWWGVRPNGVKARRWRSSLKRKTKMKKDITLYCFNNNKVNFKLGRKLDHLQTSRRIKKTFRRSKQVKATRTCSDSAVLLFLCWADFSMASLRDLA